MPNQQQNSNDDIIHIGDNTSARLNGFVERIERMQEEIDNRKEDQKEIYAEAKSIGLEVGIIKKAVARRKKDREAVLNEDALLATYEKALGERVLDEMME
jgi:uncharacterized protein (UPF0335 family)